MVEHDNNFNGPYEHVYICTECEYHISSFYHPLFSEPTLTLHNLTTLLENVEDDWYDIGTMLNLPGSKRGDIHQQHSNNRQCGRACWKLYLTEQPQPSWKEISLALYRLGHFNELEVVQNKYLKGEQ